MSKHIRILCKNSSVITGGASNESENTVRRTQLPVHEHSSEVESYQLPLRMREDSKDLREDWKELQKPSAETNQLSNERQVTGFTKMWHNVRSFVERNQLPSKMTRICQTVQRCLGVVGGLFALYRIYEEITGEEKQVEIVGVVRRI